MRKTRRYLYVPRKGEPKGRQSAGTRRAGRDLPLRVRKPKVLRLK